MASSAMVLNFRVFGFLPNTHAGANAKQMHSQSSSCSDRSTCRWPMHLTNHHYFDYGKNPKTPNLSPRQPCLLLRVQDGAGSGISSVYLCMWCTPKPILQVFILMTGMLVYFEHAAVLENTTIYLISFILIKWRFIHQNQQINLLLTVFYIVYTTIPNWDWNEQCVKHQARIWDRSQTL